MSVRTTVLAQFTQVAKEQKRQLAPLNDGLALLDTGLDSLCFAILVSRLEDALGVDPFSTAEESAIPVTVGEFVKFYEDAAK